MTAVVVTAASGRTCAACGTDVGTSLLVCPGCARLVHADELKRLAAGAALGTSRRHRAGGAGIG